MNKMKIYDVKSPTGISDRKCELKIGSDMYQVFGAWFPSWSVRVYIPPLPCNNIHVVQLLKTWEAVADPEFGGRGE